MLGSSYLATWMPPPLRLCVYMVMLFTYDTIWAIEAFLIAETVESVPGTGVPHTAAFYGVPGPGRRLMLCGECVASDKSIIYNMSDTAAGLQQASYAPIQ
jgi:hypothetical protein